MFNRLKLLWMTYRPDLLALINLAPFIVGVVFGYLFRTPISWALDLIKLLLKL